MKCPSCDLENPPNTVRCDCGYVFGPQGADPKLISRLQSIDDSVRTIKRVVIVWLILAIIAGVIALLRTL